MALLWAAHIPQSSLALPNLPMQQQMPVIRAACHESAGLLARNCMGLAARSPASTPTISVSSVSAGRLAASLSVCEKMTGMGLPSTSFQSLTCASGMSSSIGHSASCEGPAKVEASLRPRGPKEGHGSRPGRRADSSPLARSSLARSSRCADKTYSCSVQNGC